MQSGLVELVLALGCRGGIGLLFGEGLSIIAVFRVLINLNLLKFGLGNIDLLNLGFVGTLLFALFSLFGIFLLLLHHFLHAQFQVSL